MPTTARPAHSHSHPHAGGPAGSKPKLYNPRHPERTLFYQTIAEHFETWHELASAGQFDGQGDHHTPKPYCGGQMRLIAFITEGTQIRRILDHIGVDAEPPHVAPARGPPLWDGCDAQTDDEVQIEPDWATEWDGAAQPAPDYEVDQRISW